MSEENSEELKENITQNNDELAKKNQEIEEITDRLKRVMAEFENFKKRTNSKRTLNPNMHKPRANEPTANEKQSN